MMVVAKLVRLAGGDQLHTGTAAGKMGGKEKKVKKVVAINNFLRGKFYDIKTTFPVASGGIHPGIVSAKMLILGKDIAIQAGSGIHGHPWGTRAGAMAMRQAIDAFLKGIPFTEYAKTYKELKAAIEYWGERFLSEK